MTEINYSFTAFSLYSKPDADKNMALRVFYKHGEYVTAYSLQGGRANIYGLHSMSKFIIFYIKTCQPPAAIAQVN